MIIDYTSIMGIPQCHPVFPIICATQSYRFVLYKRAFPPFSASEVFGNTKNGLSSPKPL